MKFVKLLIMLAAFLWLPLVYADTCKGIHITGDFVGTATKAVVLDNTLMSDENKTKLPNGIQVAITKGKIKKATVDTASECHVASSNSGEITALMLKDATLKDVLIDGATVTLAGVDVPDVNGINGIVTGANIDAALVERILTPEQKNDPLGLADSNEIVTLTAVTTIDKKTIPLDMDMHYSGSDTGTYTMYTTLHPSECGVLPNLICNLLPDWASKANKNNKSFSGQTFVIPADQLKNRVAVRRWTSGVLVVPYKYVFASHNLTPGSQTIGPYLGYTTNLLGSEWTFPLAVGITKVTVPTLINGVAGTTDKSGLSIATGLLFKADGMTAGLLIGEDQLGSNSGYSDNGKFWLGFYVGANFGK